ncbi:hypothetical protein KL86DPRO_20041 [uncultured delta proteobacterium]|uniref:Uncharacterized protein n=1 Tax=uncultured delta proteobacterium TaxID=34034 RepID=A0A212JU11_9DELT|nr:hypothetical protein KL86DPRO_20041 [uncultured delta proteobacterium]
MIAGKHYRTIYIVYAAGIFFHKKYNTSKYTTTFTACYDKKNTDQPDAGLTIRKIVIRQLIFIYDSECL